MGIAPGPKSPRSVQEAYGLPDAPLDEVSRCLKQPRGDRNRPLIAFVGNPQSSNTRVSSDIMFSWAAITGHVKKDNGPQAEGVELIDRQMRANPPQGRRSRSHCRALHSESRR